MAAGDINDAASNIPSVVMVDQPSAGAAPGPGYARLEVVGGVLGVRVGTGAWTALASLIAGLLTGLTEKVAPAGTDLLLLQDEADAGAVKKATVASILGGGPATSMFDALVIASHRVSSGTSGGASGATGWVTLDLNTEETDTANIATLGSNQLTLPAGTYFAEAYGSVLAIGGFQMRVRDATHNATKVVGGTAYCNYGDFGTQSMAQLKGCFTLPSESAVELQGWFDHTDASASNKGLGLATSEDNIHRQLILWRFSA